VRAVTRALLDRGGAVTLLALATYVALAPTTIVDGDNAEFATLGATGGLAHPPGYPAYVLWLRAWSWLPGVSAAHTAALATCILAAATILVLHAAARAWGARPLAATAATAMIAVAPVVLRVHTEAEVFAGNALIVALILWLAAAAGPARGVRRIAWLGVVAGLGLANHTTCVLLAPVGLLGAVRGVREARRTLVAVGAGVVALGVGLLPYAYLFVAPRGGASWGHVDDLAELYRTFTRSDYGGATAFAAHDGGGTIPLSLLALARTVGRSWLWAPAALGAMALAVFAVRPDGRATPSAPAPAPPREPRIGWALLGVSWLVAGPALVSRFNVAPDGYGAYVSERFHLVPTLLLTLPIAVALDVVVARAAARRAPPRWLARPAVATTVILVAMLVAVVPTLPRLGRLHGPVVDRGLRNLLAELPPRAVVISTADDLRFGLAYLQLVEGVRPDVTAVTWILMTRPWYRAAIAAHGLRFDEHPPASDARPPSVRFAEDVLAAGRPLLVDDFEGNILRALPSYPQGTLFRVLARGATPPSLDEVLEDNRARYAAYDLAYPRPHADDELAAIVHARYAATWIHLAEALDHAGRRGESAAALDLARALGPEP
jgi:hypothetical protein